MDKNKCGLSVSRSVSSAYCPITQITRYYYLSQIPQISLITRRTIIRVAKAHALPVGQASKMMSNPVGSSCNLQASPPQLRGCKCGQIGERTAQAPTG